MKLYYYYVASVSLALGEIINSGKYIKEADRVNYFMQYRLLNSNFVFLYCMIMNNTDKTYYKTIYTRTAVPTHTIKLYYILFYTIDHSIDA